MILDVCREKYFDSFVPIIAKYPGLYLKEGENPGTLEKGVQPPDFKVDSLAQKYNNFTVRIP